MLVVFRKSDGAVIATSQSKGGVDRNRELLEEVARGQVGSPSAADFEVIEVKDTGMALGARPGNQRQQLTVRTAAGGKMEVVDATPETVFVQATTNATNFHPVDNVPLIPGDSTSFLVVTLQKVGEQARQLAQDGPRDIVIEDGDIKSIGTNDVVWLRTSHGTLREDRDPDPREIRSVTLMSGIGRFRLYSEKAKRLATVQILPENSQLQAGGLQVEFT